MRLIGYARVSTTEQGQSGLGLEAQETAIREGCAARGASLVDVVREVASGGKHDRAGLEQVLSRCGTEADGLIVAKLDRCTRSLAQFAGIMERSRRDGWAFIALDLGVDTSTPAGELIANVMASVAQWERSNAAERTRAAMAVLRAEGKLARPEQATDSAVVARIVRERQSGATLGEIVEGLERDGIPTAQGGQWRRGTLSYLLSKHAGR